MNPDGAGLGDLCREPGVVCPAGQPSSLVQVVVEPWAMTNMWTQTGRLGRQGLSVPCGGPFTGLWDSLVRGRHVDMVWTTFEGKLCVSSGGALPGHGPACCGPPLSRDLHVDVAWATWNDANYT